MCEKVLRDTKLSKKEKESRANALKKMGEMYSKAGKSKKNSAPNLHDFGVPDETPKGED